MLSFTNSVLIGIFEILKVMHELGVEIDAETYTGYVLNNFPDCKTACAQLKVSLHLKFIKMIIATLVFLWEICILVVL